MPPTHTIEEFLKGYHDRTPGSMADSALAHPLADGRTSYRFLADQVSGARRVLDLGCADGALLALCARDGAGVAGVDLSEGELALARDRPELRDADLRVARAQQLPFAGDSFDAVVSHMAFMLMSDAEQVVAEVARVLEPGGRFAVAVGLGAVPGGALDLFLSLARPVFSAVPAERQVPAMGDRRTRTRAGLDELLVPAGFSPVSWTEITLELTGTPEQLWGFAVASYYDMATLDAGQVARLHDEFVHHLSGSSPDGRTDGTRIAVATTTRAAAQDGRRPAQG
jgi:SAM-dependent methyltransferase